MTYFCAECKQTITTEEFRFSMNKYKKPLCSNHQQSNNLNPTTKSLQDLVRNRHKDDVTNEATETTTSTTSSPQLKTIKDWISADMEAWDKAINKKENSSSIIIKVSEEETKKQGFKKGKQNL